MRILRFVVIVVLCSVIGFVGANAQSTPAAAKNRMGYIHSNPPAAVAALAIIPAASITKNGNNRAAAGLSAFILSNSPLRRRFVNHGAYWIAKQNATQTRLKAIQPACE